MKRNISLPVLLTVISVICFAIIRRLLNNFHNFDMDKDTLSNAPNLSLPDITTPLADTVSKPQNVMQPDNAIPNGNTATHVVAILTANFGYWGNVQTQIRNDMTNRFYVYLVMATIFAAGLVPAANLYFTLRDAKTQFSQYTLEALIASILVAGAVLSQYFLQRTIQLSNELAKSSKYVDAISTYYDTQLVKVASDSQTPAPKLVEVRDRQDEIKNPHEVPRYIRRTIFMTGSFCNSVAAFIFFGFISFFLTRLAPSLYSSPNFWAFTIGGVTSVTICTLCVLGFRRFFFSNRYSTQTIMLRGCISLFLVLTVTSTLLISAAFQLFPLLTSNDAKAYTLAVFLSPLVFFFSLLYFWQFYHSAIESKNIRQISIKALVKKLTLRRRK